MKVSLSTGKEYLLKDKINGSRVVVEGNKSQFTPVRSGAPQGSVSGPLLVFDIHNDLPTYVDSNTRLFADDSAADRAMKTAKN